MDQEAAYTEFPSIQKKPSLVGPSVRDSYDNLPTLKSLDKIKKPLIKEHDSTAELIPVEEVRAEGALVADQEDELDEILDESGNLKENAIPDVVRLKPKSEPTRASVNTSLHSDVSKTYGNGEETSLKLLGGAAEQYAVPASGVSSSYRHSSKHRKGSDFLHKETEYIDPEQVRSVDDIINVVNKGDFEKASTLVDPKVAETIAGTRKLTLEELKLLNEQSLQKAEGNADASIPSSMLSREDSVALEELQSRSESLVRPSLTSENSFSRPNLARGESIHSGLNCDLAINAAFDTKTNAVVSERRPRHDPSNLSHGITNNSSMNYLRSISRSRSRARNDLKALQGERLESNDLRQNGALINDDEMSNAPDIEYAVHKALDFVEDTHTVKDGHVISTNGDIVKNLQRGLAEVAEEEGLADEASNRTRINAFDALENTLGQEDELMKELMGDDDLAEVEDENEDAEQNRDEGGSEQDKEENEPEEGEETFQQERIEEAEETNLERKNPQAEMMEDLQDVNLDHNKSKDMETETKAADLEGTNGETELKEGNSKPENKEDKAEEGSEVLNSDETETQGVESTKEDANAELVDQTTGNFSEVLETSNEEKLDKEVSEANKDDLDSKENDVDVEKETASTHSLNEFSPLDTETTNQEQHEASKTSEREGENIADKGSHAVTEQLQDTVKEDDTEALIAAAVRENALKENILGTGADGSVYVPKVDKMTFEDEPVYLYTSFAGGFHVTTRTNRLETILAANRIKFEYRDLGTDDEAKKIWRRYSNGKTLPGIVRGKDDYIGNWEDIEEANEDYRVRSMIYETY